MVRGKKAERARNAKRHFMRTIHEKSVGAIVFRRANIAGKHKILYLLLHYHMNDDYWEFPRGGMEQGENETQTASREIQEETGLKQGDLEFMQGFRTSIHYWYVLGGFRRSKDAVYFLAEAKTDAIVLSKEHLGFTWMEYDDAVKKLTFENARRVLKEANDFLAAKGF